MEKQTHIANEQGQGKDMSVFFGGRRRYRAVLTQQVKDQHAELCKDFLGGFLSELTGLRSHRRVSFDGKIHRSPQVFMPSMLCTFLYFVTILKL